ncbi:MAG TPA: alpha/beta fold hydrolase [Actinotalea sp.]|nr:alpha/beta fold hydrolase [Actinotalea sp.]
MVVQQVEWESAAGRRLVGLLDSPDGEPTATDLFVHAVPSGAAADAGAAAAARIARALAERGFAVLRVDVTGPGESEGPVSEATSAGDVAGLTAAATFLRERAPAQVLLVGFSLGGAAVLSTAVDLPEVRAVATIGAPAPQRPRIAALGRPLLVMHAPQDAVVGIDSAREIFDAARHPKSFVSLDGADHVLTRPADATYVADVLVAWASRYLAAPSAGSARPAAGVPAASLPAGRVLVRETGQGRFQQEVRVGTHSWIADEPEDIGGDDTGPSPYDLLLAALGTCTSMTMRMYAEHKGWPVPAITVLLERDKVRGEPDPGSTREVWVDRVRLELRVDGDLTPEQRAGFLRIADKCPVHRTLARGTLFETEFVPTPAQAPA